jgi:subtilisin family serine protease
MMVASAGNSGPACGSIDNGDESGPPSYYAAAYTVGALDTGTDTIADFSNRGPVTIDQSNRIKPDITAPGTAIRSSFNKSDSEYASLEGTSMASPHVAGAVALLWSARPGLQNNISSSRALLNSAAVHILDGTCDGGPPVTPNNTYGSGRLDIFAAVEARPAPTPRPRPTPPPRP